MISYRHHIVSLVAVFLALAVGVVLGGGPLTDLGRDDPAASADTGPAAIEPSAAPLRRRVRDGVRSEAYGGAWPTTG